MQKHSSREKCILVIPARRNSTRLPDKMLLRETGKTLLEHTYSAAMPGQEARRRIHRHRRRRDRRRGPTVWGPGRDDQPRLPQRHRPGS